MKGSKRRLCSSSRGPYPFGAFLRRAIALALFALLAASCRQPDSATVLPSNAIARVGTQLISLEAFQNELARRAALSSGNSAIDKQALLEEMIRFEVLYQKAIEAGLEKDPQVASAIKRMLVAKYQEAQLAQRGARKPTPADVSEYYQLHQERFSSPEKVRTALIEIRIPRTATAEKRAESAKKAEAVLAEARTNQPPDHTFGLLAQRYSEHQPSRYQGGDIGWLSAGANNPGWPPEVLGAAFKLSHPDDLSPVIETTTAFYLVKLIEKQPSRLRPLEEVKEGVEYLAARQLEHEQQESFQAALRKGLNIQVNQPLLDSVSVPKKEISPPALPGSKVAGVSKVVQE